MTTISVIIPLYNKEAYIQRALESVLSQTVAPLEIIVVDDGSTDKGIQVVESFKEPLIHLIQQANSGVSAARNKGIEAAKGELIAFLDADDNWRPIFLETIVRLKNVYPQAGLYATAYEKKMPNGKTFIPAYTGIPKAPWEGIIPNYFKAALGKVPVCSSAVAVKRTALDQVGYFPVGEKRAEDLDLWARIAFVFPIAFSHSIGATYFNDAANRACTLTNIVSERVVVRTIRRALQNKLIQQKERYYLKEYMYSKMLETAYEYIQLDKMAVAGPILYECRTVQFIIKKMILITLCYLPKSLRHRLIQINRLIKDKI